MTSLDPSISLLATCGGDSIKLFDLSVESNSNPCKLSFSPLPGSPVNTVRWNHTNAILASAGDDLNRISLWYTNGQSLGTMVFPMYIIQEKISAISFSNKNSRYICSVGSHPTVKRWDLKSKCISGLCGTTLRLPLEPITGAMYNCEDEHLAAITLAGDICVYNMKDDSITRLVELQDPDKQALRVLDYSPSSQHLLVTAGDDGSVHLWDTTASVPKVSWSKQHSASTTGISFSPSDEKIIASVGLDKKLYVLDSASKTTTFCSENGAHFSSMAFRDDGWVVAAGTNNGQIVLFDVRGKPQPLNTLQAYNTLERVKSLCWQRSKPTTMNENSCDPETALLGDGHSHLMKRNVEEGNSWEPHPGPSLFHHTSYLPNHHLSSDDIHTNLRTRL